MDVTRFRGVGRAAAAVALGLVLFLAGSEGSRASTADELPGPRELLRLLNEVSIDPSKIYVIRDAHITRDRVNFYFNRGFIGFLGEVSGEVTGAIFVGDGEVLLIPPDAVEKRNLASFTKSAILAEPFTSAYLRFTDPTAKELLAKSRPPDPEDPEQPTGFLEQWNPVVRRLNPDFSIRILLDLFGDRSLPYFHAHVQGVSSGVFHVVVDERQAEAVSVGAVQRNRGKLYGDIWCSFPTRNSLARESELLVGAAQVRSYRIDTRIEEDHSLLGRADLELESRSSTDRVLAFELSRRLRVSEVKDGEGRELAAIQSPSLEESPTAARGNDWIVVVLPSGIPAGQQYRITFAYRGNVIEEVGNGVLYVGARGSWYPNRGMGMRSHYDMTFSYPERLTLVATGNRVEEGVSEGWKHSRWISGVPFAVAGFNLGAYDWRARRSGGTILEAYAARGAEESLERRHVQAHPQSELVVHQTGEGPKIVNILPKRVPPLDPAALLDHVVDEAEGAVRYFETLFGPFPYPHLAISQMPGHFGQGWPGLVYLPTLAFLPEVERSKMGLGARSQEFQHQLSAAHEIAHQWWGNHVGWKTYRDQWLSEGFATYAAALHLGQGKEGERRFHELLRSYKEDLLRKAPEGSTIESGGPIWLGHRLSNSLNPDGYANITYKKACWVVHMLRGLMTDTATGSGEAFFRMLRDFLAAYRGQNPSTEDFIRHVEKYTSRAIDLGGNRRLDWFFNAWVYGTGVPTYRLEVTIRRVTPRKYVIEGNIEQSGVSPEFEALVPLVATHAKERTRLLGRVAVGGNGGRFRFTTTNRPTRVAIDEENLLAIVRP